MNEIVLEKVSLQIFGITPRHYRRLANQGAVPFPDRGKINFLQAAKALIEYYRGMIDKTSTTLEHEKNLKIITERKLKELQLAIRAGELIATSKIPELIEQRKRVVSRELMRFCRLLPQKIVNKESRLMGGIIRGEVNSLLKRIGNAKMR